MFKNIISLHLIWQCLPCLAADETDHNADTG